MQKVEAYVAYAVYADYDGNAPDSADLVVLESEELAKDLIKTAQEQHVEFCYCEGHEWSKRYKVRPVLVASPEGVATNIEGVLEEYRDTF